MLLILLGDDTPVIINAFCVDLSTPQSGATVNDLGVNGVATSTTVNGAVATLGLSAMENPDDC